MAKAENIKRYVVRVLKEAGIYRAELTYQIEMLANELIVYRSLMKKAEEVGENDEAIITEQSREGDERLRPHPIYAMVQAQANQLRQDLKVLLMNYDKTDNSQIKKEENVLADVLAKIDKDEDDED